MFNFLRLIFRLCGTAPRAPMTIGTISKRYPAYILDISQTSGMYSPSFQVVRMMTFVSRGAQTSTKVQTFESWSHIVISGRLCSTFIGRLIKAFHHISFLPSLVTLGGFVICFFLFSASMPYRLSLHKLSLQLCRVFGINTCYQTLKYKTTKCEKYLHCVDGKGGTW